MSKPFLKYSLMLLASLPLLLSSACATRYNVKSFPEGATVFVKDLITQEKKLVGQTPLTLKKTKEMGEVFFFTIEKDNFVSKQILMTSKDGENLTLSVILDPATDATKDKLADKDKDKGDQKGQSPEDKKKEDAMKDLNLRIALLENTVAMQKDALFSGRYNGSGGPARFDRGQNDDIVDHLFKAQQLVMLKKYPDAQNEVDQALLIDEYLPQAYLIKGTIFYVNKDYKQAKIAWERCLKVDPYNAQAYNYLRLVDKKLAVAMPPDRPSMLRAPATDEFSRPLEASQDKTKQ